MPTMSSITQENPGYTSNSGTPTDDRESQTAFPLTPTRKVEKERVLTRFMQLERHPQHSTVSPPPNSPYQTPNAVAVPSVSTEHPDSAAPDAPIVIQSAPYSFSQQEAIAGPSSAPAPATRTNARLDSPQPQAQPRARKLTKVASGSRNNPQINGPMPSAQRAAYIARFTYAGMRDTSVHSSPLLPKVPSSHDVGVIFHAPDAPGVDYSLFRKTTHNFLDFDTTFALYPTYCLLPVEMKPSKDDWDDTREADQDDACKVRCLFCRARFGGRNAKAMWERHAREHWDKGGERL